MRDSDHYAKIVKWSEKDQCYVGTAPSLMYGGCHGDDQKLVFAELCEIVDEVIEALRAEGEQLPLVAAAREMVDA
jgi:predicted RNase H-like HicB family nuclease